MQLLLDALAGLWAFEFLLTLLPVPAPLAPLLVAALCYGADALPAAVRLALAAAALVGLAQVLVREKTTRLTLPRRSSRPPRL